VLSSLRRRASSVHCRRAPASLQAAGNDVAVATPRSVRAATIRRTIAASLGRSPQRRCDTWSRRSSAPGDCRVNLPPVRCGEGYVREHGGFGLTHEPTDRREALSDLIGDCAPLSSGLASVAWAKPARMMAATIRRWPLGTSTNTFRMKCTRQRCHVGSKSFATAAFSPFSSERYVASARSAVGTLRNPITTGGPITRTSAVG
jgi:hypothetical protein